MSDNIHEPQQFYKTYLEFHENIFKTHVKCMHHLVAVLPFDRLNQIDITAFLNQKKPILNGDNLIIEEKDLEYIFDLIFPIFKKYFYRRKEQILRLEELNDKRKISLRKLIVALITRDVNPFVEISNKYDIPVILLEKVLEFVASPYLELCAEFFNKKLSNLTWNQPFCPICGNMPSMATVNEKKASRNLWCRFCDNIWSFDTTICPYCFNNDLKSIHIIFLTDGKPIRIEACENCKNYIKTVDELVAFKKYNLSVKYVETFYLDMLAKDYGYQLQEHTKFYLEAI